MYDGLDANGDGIFDYLFEKAHTYKESNSNISVEWKPSLTIFRGVRDCQYYINVFKDKLIDTDNPKLPIIEELIATKTVDNAILAAYMLKDIKLRDVDE